MTCIVCLEHVDKLYKCQVCTATICKECYGKLRKVSCIICETGIFNEELKEYKVYGSIDESIPSSNSLSQMLDLQRQDNDRIDMS